MFAIIAFVTDLLVFYLGFKTTITDPTDVTVRIERYHRLTKQSFDDSQYEFYCNHCDTNVRALSKHCGRCQRCTAHFDHHCIWLNNCIGYNNYKPFFLLLIMTIIHSLGIMGLGTWRVLYYFKQAEFFRAPTIYCYIMILVNGLAACLIFYLLTYHIWLIAVGKTTYSHIMEQRKREQEKQNQKYLKQQEKKTPRAKKKKMSKIAQGRAKQL